MKPRTVLLLAVAVVCGLVGAYMVAKLMSRPTDEGTVVVLVARSQKPSGETEAKEGTDDEISQGTYLKGIWDKNPEHKGVEALQKDNKFFEKREYPKGQEPKNAITDPQKLEGRILAKALPVGQFVTENDLVPKDKQVEIPEEAPAREAREQLEPIISELKDAKSFPADGGPWGARLDEIAQRLRKAEESKKHKDYIWFYQGDKDKPSALAEFQGCKGKEAALKVLDDIDQHLARIQHKWIAVAVAVNAEQSGGGFVLPHTHVDLIYTEPTPVTNKPRTRKILFDVEVLGVDNMAELPPDKARAYNARTLTLALTREQSERLALAAEHGKFTFTVLRPDQWNNEEATETRKKNNPYIYAGGDPDKEGQDQKPAPVKISVAREDITPDKPLKPELFKAMAFDRGEAPPNAIRTIDLGTFLKKNEKRKLRKTLAAGKWLTEDALDAPEGKVDRIPRPQRPNLLVVKNGKEEIHWFYREPGSLAERVEAGANLESKTPNVKSDNGSWEIDGDDLDGGRIKLSDFRGKIVVLTFWAHASDKSRELYPWLKNLATTLDKAPVVFLGVNVDTNRAAAKKAAQTEKLPGPSWWDEGGQLAKSMDVTGIPTTLILDPKGVARFTFVGQQDKGVVDSAIAHLIKEREKPKENGD
jgi:Flp pilus assembly protein CpaB/peroxiredoxin